jgi:uncharacterized membrane protein YfcA
VQGLSGFAYGLTAMSIWAWTLDPQLAAALGVFGSLVGQLIAVFTVRRGFDLVRLLPFLAGAACGLPVGLLLLPHLDMPLFKFVLGTLLVVLCPLLFFAARLPRLRGGRVGDGLAGAIGGVMGGLGGFTGVVPTLWCTLSGLDKDRQRAIIQNFNLAVLVVTFGSYAATGVITRAMLPMFAVVAPAMLIPALLGGRLYVGISEAAFRKVVLGLLTAGGVALLASSAPVIVARLQGS